MSSAREVAQRIAAIAAERKVRFPKIWDDSKIVQACGTTLMLYKSGSGFDEDATIADLIDKYGVEQEVVAQSSSPTKGKRKADGDVKTEKDDKEATSPSSAAKKVKKTEVVAVEANRPAAEAIKEMADIYFKAKDMRKGGVFSKAAKAIRECDFVITDKKGAMKLPGVGKGIAGYIEELLDMGSIKHLEELRAGTA